MNFQIKNRFSGEIQFECELSAGIADKSYSLKLGFAIKEAISARANLADANLAGAYLAGADLARANLAGAKNVPETNGSESTQEEPADRRERQLARAARFRQRFPDVPVVEQLDAKILAAIETGGMLEMGSWHQCETTHCRGGWAVTLAGEPGKQLEECYGVEDAARRIYLASTGRCPWFFDSNEGALADIRAQAELLKAPAP